MHGGPIRSAVHYPLPPRAERPITVGKCAKGNDTPWRRAHSSRTFIRPLPRVVSQRRITGVPHHTTPGTRGAGHPIQLHSHQVAPREMPPGGLHSLEFKPLCALTISPFGWRSHLPCGPGLFHRNMIIRKRTTITLSPHHISSRTDATRFDAVCPPANLY